MFTIGRHERSDEPSERLRACHERIRKFLAMAARLASDEPATDDDIWAAAGAVARYFDDALPLHERDEDESVAPRLAALPEVTAMRAQHDEMHAQVAALIAVCQRIAASTRTRAAASPELRATLDALVPAMDAHLAAEEAVILPAIDALPADERAALVREMTARRTA